MSDTMIESHEPTAFEPPLRAPEFSAAESRWQKRSERAEALVDLWEHALTCVEVDELYAQAAERLRAYLDVDGIEVLEKATHANLLFRAAVVGDVAAAALGDAVALDSESVYQLAFTSREPLIFENSDGKARPEAADAPIRPRASSCVALPIVADGAAHGVLALHACAERRFDGDDVEFAQEVARIVARAAEHGRGEQLLVESRRLFEAAFNSFSAHLVVIDAVGRVMAVNSAWKRLTATSGYDSLDYGVGSNYLEGCLANMTDNDRDAQHAARGVREVIDGTRASFTFEYCSVRGGCARWFAMNATRLEGGAPGNVMVAHREITENRAAEAALAASEERFKRAVKGSSDGLWDWDLATDYVFYSPRFKEMLGYDDAEFRDELQSLDSHIHPDDRGLVWEAVRRHFDEQRPFEVEFRIRTKSGQYRWFRDRGVAFRDESGVPIHMAGSMQDVTDRRAAEQATRHLAAIVESSCDGIISNSLDGTILSWNAGAAQLLGYTRDEAVGRNVAFLVPRDRLDEESDFLGRVSQGEQISDCETIRLHRGGRPIDVALTMSPISDGSGRVVAISCMLRDISERIETRKALMDKDRQLLQQQKLQAVGELAGGIAHEFNNLLQAIQGFTKFAIEGIDPDEQRYKDLDHVLVAADRAARLTRQLLRFSRREELCKSAVDPNALVSEIAALLRPLIGEQIELKLCLGQDVGTIVADPNLVQQMLMNLCVNARDAMHDGGQLVVTTQGVTLGREFCDSHPNVAPGRYAVLTVADTGIGMPPAVKEHIFEPFFTTKDVGKGTGLGLSMVYGVVQQHHGAIDVTSQPGEGTTFRVYLPTSCQPAEGCSPKAPVPGASGVETILVAEDDPMVCDLAVRILRKAGYRVLVANDGDEAIRVFRENADSVDLALLDLVMPKLSGRNVYQAIKLARRDVRVVFASGYNPEMGYADFVERDDLHFVQKPFDPSALLSVVRHALARDEANG